MIARYIKTKISSPEHCPNRDPLRSEKTGRVTFCICRHIKTNVLFCNDDCNFPDICPLEQEGQNE